MVNLAQKYAFRIPMYLNRDAKQWESSREDKVKSGGSAQKARTDKVRLPLENRVGENPNRKISDVKATWVSEGVSLKFWFFVVNCS